MKNKILMAVALTIIFALTDATYAMSQNNSTGTTGPSNQAQNQNQVKNQGEANQIQVQSSEQSQQKPQDGTGSSNQAQNQNQVKNQGEANQIQTNEQGEIQNGNKNGSAVSEQRKSKVANAVQEILQLADRNNGIGQQVKTVAQSQTQNQEKLETSLQKVQDQNSFVRFFIGPNYGEINSARKLLEQNKEQVNQLNQIKNQLVNQNDAQKLTQQIKVLEQVNLEIEDSLESTQKEFSLFGWITKLFNK